MEDRGIEPFQFRFIEAGGGTAKMSKIECRDQRIAVAGPTTLLALMTSFQMGFRTLAIQERSSEVWRTLGAVKTEFERYGTWVEKIREQVRKASDTLETATTRTNQMRRALKVVEALPEAQAQALLPPLAEGDDSP